MICRLCKQDLPLHSFTSTQAKYCLNCKRIRMLEQRNAMMKRSMDRQKAKKPKKQVVQSLPSLKATAQKLINKYCRLRDIKDGCISCEKGASEQGGHYLSVGANSALRFDERNINGQCSSCNHFKSGNPIEYRIRLVQKIGREQVEWLEAHRKDIKKWSREELEEIIKTYRSKLS
jgi:hypothetical protein